MALGLLFSVWPWGLAPVPGAGLLLTLVSLSGWLARRRPELPLRLRGSDALVLGTVAVVWHYVHRPVAGKSAADRLAYFVTSEDRLGHFSYFDGIHHVGGYAFLHQEAARTYMMTPAEAVYPQGSHFLLAWTDVLVRSSTDAGSALGMTHRYLLYVLAAYALFCGALVWACRLRDHRPALPVRRTCPAGAARDGPGRVRAGCRGRAGRRDLRLQPLRRPRRHRPGRGPDRAPAEVRPAPPAPRCPGGRDPARGAAQRRLRPEQAGRRQDLEPPGSDGRPRPARPHRLRPAGPGGRLPAGEPAYRHRAAGARRRPGRDRGHRRLRRLAGAHHRLPLVLL